MSEFKHCQFQVRNNCVGANNGIATGTSYQHASLVTNNTILH